MAYDVYVDLKDGEDFTIPFEGSKEKDAAKEVEVLARSIVRNGYDKWSKDGVPTIIPSSDIKAVTVRPRQVDVSAAALPSPRVSPSR